MASSGRGALARERLIDSDSDRGSVLIEVLRTFKPHTFKFFNQGARER
jgi:hypothetical protein